MGKMGLDDNLLPIINVAGNIENDDHEEGEVIDSINDDQHGPNKKKDDTPENTRCVHDLRKKLDSKKPDNGPSTDTRLPDVRKEIKAVLNDFH